jgi:hypothetical protein
VPTTKHRSGIASSVDAPTNADVYELAINDASRECIFYDFPSRGCCGLAVQAARIMAAISMMAKNLADPSMSYSLLFNFVDDRVL